MKRTISILAALLCIIGFRFLPAPSGMTSSAMQVLGIFIGALILWLTLSIDWPSLLALAALVTVPELTMGSVLANSLGNSTVAFLLFTFMCTYAISKTSFVKRCAILFISSRIARRSPWCFLILYCASILVIGLVMSPSVVFVIYLPILRAICEELELRQDDRLANALMLGQLFSSAISCGMTPLPTCFPSWPLDFIKTATGTSVSYIHYMAFAVPVGLLCFAAMLLLFRFVLRPDLSCVSRLDFDALKRSVTPADRREKATLIIFFLVVAMWVLPEFIEPILPAVASFLDTQGTAFPPLVGAVALCLLSVGGAPLMNFKEAMQKGVEWGSVIMAGATLALGSAMTNAEIGLTDWLSGAIAPTLNGLPVWLLILVFTVWAAVMTNVASNMVTVTVVCAVAIPLCMASGGAVSTPAIAMIIGMLASYAFVTPPAHPNVPLAIGSGWTKTGQVILYGHDSDGHLHRGYCCSRLPHCQRSYGRIIPDGGAFMDELHALRQKIDLLDCQLVELFEQRMELVCQIAKLKQRQHIPILQSSREQEVLRHARSLLHNPAYTDSLTDFMVHLMALSRAEQARHQDT